jgi:hypothetical protein
MTRDDVFPSKYLKAADLKGRPHTVTIESAPYETLKSLDGKETQKVVLYFRGAEKTLPLNVTNFDAVCDATGCYDTDDWPGQLIELYPTRTTMGGKAVDCIRVRKPTKPVQPSAQPPAQQETAPEPFALADEMDDAIPF